MTKAHDMTYFGFSALQESYYLFHKFQKKDLMNMMITWKALYVFPMPIQCQLSFFFSLIRISFINRETLQFCAESSAESVTANAMLLVECVLVVELRFFNKYTALPSQCVHVEASNTLNLGLLPVIAADLMC